MDGKVILVCREKDCIMSVSKLWNQAREQANLHVQGLLAQAGTACTQFGSSQAQAGLQSARSAQAEGRHSRLGLSATRTKSDRSTGPFLFTVFHSNRTVKKNPNPNNKKTQSCHHQK